MRKLIITLIIAIVGSFSVFTQETEENVVKIWTVEYRESVNSGNYYNLNDINNESWEFFLDTSRDFLIESGIYKYDVELDMFMSTDPTLVREAEYSDSKSRRISIVYTIMKYVDGVSYEISMLDTKETTVLLIYTLYVYIYENGVYDATDCFGTGYDYKTGIKSTTLQDRHLFSLPLNSYRQAFLQRVPSNYLDDALRGRGGIYNVKNRFYNDPFN